MKSQPQLQSVMSKQQSQIYPSQSTSGVVGTTGLDHRSPAFGAHRESLPHNSSYGVSGNVKNNSAVTPNVISKSLTPKRASRMANRHDSQTGFNQPPSAHGGKHVQNTYAESQYTYNKGALSGASNAGLSYERERDRKKHQSNQNQMSLSASNSYSRHHLGNQGSQGANSNVSSNTNLLHHSGNHHGPASGQSSEFIANKSMKIKSKFDQQNPSTSSGGSTQEASAVVPPVSTSNAQMRSSHSNLNGTHLPNIQSQSIGVPQSNSVLNPSPYHSSSLLNVNQNKQMTSVGSTHMIDNSNGSQSDYFNMKQSVGQSTVGGRSTSQNSTLSANSVKSHQPNMTYQLSNQQFHGSSMANLTQGTNSIDNGRTGSNQQQRSSSEPPQVSQEQSLGDNSKIDPNHISLQANNFLPGSANKNKQALQFIMRTVAAPRKRKAKTTHMATPNQPQASASVKATVAKMLMKNQNISGLPFFQNSKVSQKAFGAVKAFAANTNVGTVRKSNEDRIAIILNVIQPALKEPRVPSDQWPKLQIFGVYDGHGGSKCAEYLKDTLHNNIILQAEFPRDIKTAIFKGARKTEEDFLGLAYTSPNQPHNKAGSCAIMVMVVNEDIYTINVGDSRALSSISEFPSQSSLQNKNAMADSKGFVHVECTSQVKQVSNDHKPSDPSEFKRIVKAGGHIYQTQTVMKGGMPTNQVQQVKLEHPPPPEDSDEEDNPFVGPYRVFPGRLSVCRTFGDCEAKLPALGGMPGVVTCEPEIHYEQDGVNKYDYILIGSDGIYDKLKNEAINQIVWDIATSQRQKALSQQKNQTPSIHQISGLIADEILHSAARNRSLDNLSIVFIAFRSFKEYIEMVVNAVEQQHAQNSFSQKPNNYVESAPTTGQHASQPSSQTTAERLQSIQQAQQQNQQSKMKSPQKRFTKKSNLYHLQPETGVTNPDKVQPITTGAPDLSNGRKNYFKLDKAIPNSTIANPQIKPSTDEAAQNNYSSMMRNANQEKRQLLLDNKYRPQSRNSHSRQNRTRKPGQISSNNGGSNASHSQETRPTLPPMSKSTSGSLKLQSQHNQSQQSANLAFHHSNNQLYQAVGSQQIPQSNSSNHRRGALFKVQGSSTTNQGSSSINNNKHSVKTIGGGSNTSSSTGVKQNSSYRGNKSILTKQAQQNYKNNF